jgi:hypothetical protein
MPAGRIDGLSFQLRELAGSRSGRRTVTAAKFVRSQKAFRESDAALTVFSGAACHTASATNLHGIDQTMSIGGKTCANS